MKMVIGGAFQGKLKWAKERYPGVEWLDGRTCRPEEIFSCRGICSFHEYIRRLLVREGGKEAASKLAGDLISRNPEIIIITDEIGCGLVPIDPFDRMYRETVGRICTKLAGFSVRVDRIIMGVGAAIKETEE